ncbi:hypothetical protein L228DRAFT_246542 [Xylona heveae TC161]|uniref:Uncharacterized protein n=1 Tax=Xylona heveae (strain CBS 132557 / TC161) TaxID=1328760 RepID=A0A165HLM3_XYLHT|nr:hypothetical protein L228DRAFT_246542 [Xylona heveae TC161]KZF23702.1 hypothetical protein L228DRAFT_246542 [Xylona heveae TC161]
MRLLAVVTLLLLSSLGYGLTCENAADPDHDIGNYCACSDGTCHFRSPRTGCNPPSVRVPCP